MYDFLPLITFRSFWKSKSVSTIPPSNTSIFGFGLTIMESDVTTLWSPTLLYALTVT